MLHLHNNTTAKSYAHVGNVLCSVCKRSFFSCHLRSLYRIHLLSFKTLIMSRVENTITGILNICRVKYSVTEAFSTSLMPPKFKVYVHRLVCLCVGQEQKISVVCTFLSVFLFKILHFL